MKWLLSVFLGAKINFCSVYIFFLVPILIKRLSKQKSAITATDRLLTQTISVIYMHSHSLLQDQIHFWILSLFFVFCFSFLPWQYLPVLELCFHCFIAFMSFQSFCLYLCSCRELLLMMHAWFSWACSLLLSDLTRQHQLSDEQRRKSKCECVDGDRDHYLWWPQAVWGQYTRIVHITNAKFCNLEDWVLKAGL